MSSDIAKRYLPGLWIVSYKLEQGIEITSDDEQHLSNSLASGHRTIISVAALTISNFDTDSHFLYSELNSLSYNEKRLMLDAFVRIARFKIANKKTNKETISINLLELSYDKNMFLQLEASRLLLKYDKQRALQRLRELNDGEYKDITSHVIKLLRQNDEDIKFMPGPRDGQGYAFVVSTIKNAAFRVKQYNLLNENLSKERNPAQQKEGTNRKSGRETGSEEDNITSIDP